MQLISCSSTLYSPCPKDPRPRWDLPLLTSPGWHGDGRSWVHASRIHLASRTRGKSLWYTVVQRPNGAFRRILKIGKCNCSISWHIDHKTKQKRAPRRANIGETKAWQPTGKLIKDINTNSNNRWRWTCRTAEVMIHDEQVVGRHSIPSTPILHPNK